MITGSHRYRPRRTVTAYQWRTGDPMPTQACTDPECENTKRDPKSQFPGPHIGPHIHSTSFEWNGMAMFIDDRCFIISDNGEVSVTTEQIFHEDYELVEDAK